MVVCLLPKRKRESLENLNSLNKYILEKWCGKYEFLKAYMEKIEDVTKNSKVFILFFITCRYKFRYNKSWILKDVFVLTS